jgi:toxin YoeB
LKLAFSPNAWEEYLFWQANDAKVLERLNALIKECRRSPFKGTGKPEALKGNLAGCWSRRITHEDRLVYRVSGKGDDQQLDVLQCRFHY